jgi:hypothetical protein
VVCLLLLAWRLLWRGLAQGLLLLVPLPQVQVWVQQLALSWVSLARSRLALLFLFGLFSWLILSLR